MYSVKRTFDRQASRQLAYGDADVVVAMFGAARQTFIAARSQGVRTVLNFVNSHPDVHNDTLLDLPECGVAHHELIPEHIVRVVRDELALADMVLVPSQFVADQLTSRGVQESVIRVEPYGFDPGVFGVRVESRPQQRTVLCVSHVSHRKGIDVLAQAARRVGREARFLLIGPMVSPEVLKGAPKNLEYVGERSQAQIADAMREAHVFVLPSREDAYALVVLEAMACGVPVITTRSTGVSEMIEDRKNGMLVDAGEDAQLSTAILTLIRNERLAQRLADEGITTVGSGFGWDEYGARVLKQMARLSDGAASAKL